MLITSTVLRGEEAPPISAPRIKKSPHNAYASLWGIQRAIEKLGYSQEYDADYDGHFKFAKEGTQAVMHGADVREAYKVTPGYKLNNPWFEYHEDDGLYYRFQYGGPHMGKRGTDCGEEHHHSVLSGGLLCVHRVPEH